MTLSSLNGMWWGGPWPCDNLIWDIHIQNRRSEYEVYLHVQNSFIVCTHLKSLYQMFCFILFLEISSPPSFSAFGVPFFIFPSKICSLQQCDFLFVISNIQILVGSRLLMRKVGHNFVLREKVETPSLPTPLPTWGLNKHYNRLHFKSIWNTQWRNFRPGELHYWANLFDLSPILRKLSTTWIYFQIYKLCSDMASARVPTQVQ